MLNFKDLEKKLMEISVESAEETLSKLKPEIHRLMDKFAEDIGSLPAYDPER